VRTASSRCRTFPDEAGVEAEAAWSDFNQRVERVLSPDEPHEAEGVPRLDATNYQGRLWATRRRPWVDRVASAWLIRRFIDPAARFRWLAKPEDCPKRALGFDFDGAAFTHVGDRVTFETLITEGGRRKTLKYVDAPVAVNAWHVLRAEFTRKRIKVFLDGKSVIEFDDAHIAGAGAGAVGVWTRADSVTAFDDFSFGANPKP
jgi:hypothetical protein